MGRRELNSSNLKRPSNTSTKRASGSLDRKVTNPSNYISKEVLQDDKIQELVEDAIRTRSILQIILLLSHKERNMRRVGADALSDLSKLAEFRESAGPAIPQMIGLLGSSPDVCTAVANALVKLSEHAEFRESIRAAIPSIIILLSHSDPYVCSEGADALAKLSEQAEFRESIRPAIPQIIRLLGSTPDVCMAVANVLVKLSEHAEFRESIRPAVPQMIGLLRSSLCVGVVANALEKLSKHAEFRESIRAAIPPIITLLSHRDPYVCSIGADALAKLSEHTEFRESIRPAIPKMIGLLKSLPDVCMVVANALVKLSEHAEFRELIGAAIPPIITLFSHSMPHVCRKGADTLAKLSEYAEFREPIMSAIPQMIDLLGSSPDVCTAAAGALVKLSVQAGFRESIRPAIPQMIDLLGSSPNVCTAAAGALVKFSEHAEFRESIRPAIPQMIGLLESSPDVCMVVANALVKLSEHAEFRESIGAAIPPIITLLSYSAPDIRSIGADALSKLSAQVEFRESIRVAIPQIITFLNHSTPHFHRMGADTLVKLSEYAEYRESIRSAIPQMIDLLKSSQDNRIVVTDALMKLSEQAEFRESIRAAIPPIITLLSHSAPYVRSKGADALLKLSVQVEFRESIRVAIPQIITLLSHSTPYVCSEGADALVKLSEQAEFRESIRPAIPQMIDLLGSSPDVCTAAADALVKFSEHVEFRESIRVAIPQIITLLSHSDPYVCSKGADALAKLAEHVEFRESIRVAIPQIITLLSHSDPYVCSKGADALAKLSEHTEFRESIMPAIPQIITLFKIGVLDVCEVIAIALIKLSEQAEFRELIQSAIPEINVFLSDPDKIHHVGAYILPKLLVDPRVTVIPQQNTFLYELNTDAHMAGVAASAKLPDDGTNADSASDIVNNDKLKHSWTTTCWIAAEHALQHAGNNISSVSEVLGRWKIQKSEYVVQAGFDESLIKSGVGYLEQIHIFVFAEVDATSPLLLDLGKLFSPFSSILFTKSSSYHLPVFKDDGSVWEFDELVYFTASKFADGGSSTKFPLTIISLSQTPNLADGTAGSTQSSSGSGEGEKNKKQRSEKGKERDMGDKDEADKGSDIPEDPPGDLGGIIARPAEISFEITSEIYPLPLVIQDKPNDTPSPYPTTFQALTMHGGLTIETTPLTRNPHQFSERFVQFTELTFQTKPPTDMTAYKQIQLWVHVNSQQETARVKDIKPKKTSDSDGEEKQSSSLRSAQTCGITANFILGPQPQATITGAATKTNEETAGSEKKRNRSAINQQHSGGIISWDFKIDDVNFQKHGLDLREDNLPTVRFMFVGETNVPAPPPDDMDIAITSCWSMILPGPSEPKSTWIRKLLHSFKSTANTGNTSPTVSYSNLFQIVALRADLSKLTEPSHYVAKVKFKSGASCPPDVEVKRKAADSVDMTPTISIDLKKLNLPKFAKFKLSDNCIPILDRESKSH